MFITHDGKEYKTTNNAKEQDVKNLVFDFVEKLVLEKDVEGDDEFIFFLFTAMKLIGEMMLKSIDEQVGFEGIEAHVELVEVTGQTG